MQTLCPPEVANCTSNRHSICPRLAALVVLLFVAGTISSASEAPVRRLDAAKDHAWRLSLYPGGHTFAFTIVHDADSAYSQRLAPLFEVFDALNMKITATVFVFWADWANNGKIWSSWNRVQDPRQKLMAPKAVPLVDSTERDFYRKLAAEGHEIGMHTPSDTSDTTAQLQQAFEYFDEVFGHFPTIYVEHSHDSNQETLGNQGENPRSEYFSLAMLKHYHPWVWVDGPLGLPSESESGYYDLIASQVAPFSDEPAKRYGYDKIFARTGKWKLADGDGFLQEYSTSNVDELERNRGIALVYTHLDSKWLDPDTHKMRGSLSDRLKYITSKNGWFVPASTILDRVIAMRELSLDVTNGYLRVRNRGAEKIDAVTVISPGSATLCASKSKLRRGPRGDIVLGDIQPHQTIGFRFCH